MSKRIHTIEIEGYGQVQVRSLGKDEVKAIRRKSRGPVVDEGDRLADFPIAERRRFREDTHFLLEGLESPRPDTEQELRDAFTDEQILAIVAAIRERSWPNEGRTP